MLDKKKIGNYLRELRLSKKREKNGKPFSQEDLANEFAELGIYLSISAIAEWENGTSLPSFSNLEILSKMYNKSIDELLEGEDINDIDYTEKYFIYDRSWGLKFDRNAPLYKIRNEQILLINKRFNELLKIRINRQHTISEEREFKFLFDNFYLLSDYGRIVSKSEINDDYVLFKSLITDVLIKNKNMAFDEKYWEITKFFIKQEDLWFKFCNDVEGLKSTPILQKRYKELNVWEKDMLLAMFQILDTFDPKPDKYGARYYKNYEKNHGEYNHEIDAKNSMKILIKNGARLNRYYLNKIKVNKITHRIVDKLEELYELCIKPLRVDLATEQGCDDYAIENNSKNRFICNYYYELSYSLKTVSNKETINEDIDEIYKWFINNEKISDEVYLKIAKAYGVDTNDEKKYWIAEVKRISLIDDVFYKCKHKEKEIEIGLKEIKLFEDKLNKGESTYIDTNKEMIGGTDEKSFRKHISVLNSKLSYKEYLSCRDDKLTKALLKDLDILSLDEIKAKYFDMEEIKDE